MSKPISAVAVERKMTKREAADFHLRMAGKPFGAWHKPKRVSEVQAKFGVGIPFNVGSNRKKRARRANGEKLAECCGRKFKNCRCH